PAPGEPEQRDVRDVAAERDRDPAVADQLVDEQPKPAGRKADTRQQSREPRHRGEPAVRGCALHGPRVIIYQMGRPVLVAALVAASAHVAIAAPKKVRIETTPAGATVYLNAKEDGIACKPTPCDVEVPSGETT